MSVDYLIVGGGIGGAVLAARLAQGGKRVLVLERASAAGGLVRPEVLWPQSMRVLSSLVPLECLRERAVLPLRGIEFHDGTRVSSLFRESTLRAPHVQPWSTDPNQTRELLLGVGTFEVRRGVEVVSVLKESGWVVGVRARDLATRTEIDVLAGCTVGDDGAQSRVRQSSGIDLDAREFPVAFACFGCEWPSAVPSGCARVWWNPQALATGIIGLLIMPLPTNRCAALVPVISRTFAANATVDSCWDRFRRIDPVISAVLAGRRFPEDTVRIHRPWGHASRYGADGVILLGDAVHPVSPAGGQGANMSIADAAVLADLVLGGSANILADYEARRRPANAASIRPTRIAAWVWSLPQWLSPIPLAPFMARRVGQCPALQLRLAGSSARLFQEAAA